MPKILNAQAYLDTVCQLLLEGGTHIPVTLSGMSMTPFLDPGDTVFLDLPPKSLSPGDVLLYRRPSGQYVLHRLIRREADGKLWLLGDAQLQPESVRPEQVRAVVTAARRGERLLDRSSLRWKFFRGPWRHLTLLRPPVNRIRNHVRRQLGKQ